MSTSPAASGAAPAVVRNKWLLCVVHTLWLALGITVFPPGLAATTDLPDPLSLEQALAIAEQPHPDIELVEAQLALARAERLAAGSRLGLRAHVELSPKVANPSTRSGTTNDSHVRLLISKSLYDFGRTRAYVEAADANITSQQYELLDTRLKRRIGVLEAFYDVALADLRYAVDNEEMSRRFVNYDRVREAHDVGQVSDVELLEAENYYLEALNQRAVSAKAQRVTRQRLALNLNRPAEIPGDLKIPPADIVNRKTPEFEALFSAARGVNPEILSLQNKILSAKADVRAARAQRNPVLSADFELGQYARSLSARSDASAGINLRIPIYQGGETRAAIAHANARLSADQAELSRALHRLRQRILELVQQLETLGVERNTARQRLRYRELSLDRERALYEMEMQTSLGSALTKMTEADWLAARVEFSIALTWAEIDALLGKPALHNLQDTSL